MAEQSLKIDDDYCIAMGNYFSQEGQQLETFIGEYIRILDNIKDKAIIKGDVANSLKSYIGYANKLKGQINDISSTVQQQITTFLKSVDDADQYLF